MSLSFAKFNRLAIVTALVSLTSTVHWNASAGQFGDRFASRWMQDEADELPSENTAFFSAAGKVRLQLDWLGNPNDSSMEDNRALVTVVRPDGTRRDYTPDADGGVTIDDAKPGPHGVVASSAQAHGTTLLWFEKMAAGDQAANERDTLLDPFDDDVPDANKQAKKLAIAPPTRVTMFPIDVNELLPLLEQTTSDEQPSGSLAIGSDVKSSGRSFGYRVSLDDDGVLRGQVMSVARRAKGTSLAGTQIVIFFQGVPVGSTTCDASGMWKITGVRPGVHGLVASGPAGYAAIAFAARPDNAIAARRIDDRKDRETLVTRLPDEDKLLPVVLVPPPMMPAVRETITTYYPAASGPSRLEINPLGSGADGITGSALAESFGGAGSGAIDPSATAMDAGAADFGISEMGMSGNAAPAPTGGGGFGGGAAGGGGGFGGGLGGLAGLGAIGAIAATAIDDDDDAPGIAASPFTP